MQWEEIAARVAALPAERRAALHARCIGFVAADDIGCEVLAQWLRELDR